MIRLARYLKGSVGVIACILILLILQANCDLELPNYTSKIVTQGIQQKGVEDAVPQRLTKQSFEDLQLFMNDEEITLLTQSYEQDPSSAYDEYVLTKEASENREALASILEKPETVLMLLTSDSDVLQSMNLGGGASSGTTGNTGTTAGMDPSAILPALRLLPKAMRSQMLSKMDTYLQAMPEATITQMAVRFVQQEYESMGIDLSAIQNRYLLITGAKMLGLAFFAMLCTLAVAFLCARLAAGTAFRLRNDVYRKVMSFNSEEFSRFSTASLITRSTNDIQQVQMFLGMGMRVVLYAPILGIGGVVKVVNTNASQSWVIALAVGLILVLILVLFKIAMPKFVSLQTLIDRLNLVTREQLSGVMVTRAFSAEKHEEERFEKANRELTGTLLFVNRCMTFMMPLMMVILNGVSVLIVYSGAYAIDAGRMQVGDIMAFIQYAMQIIMSFLMISMMSVILPRANVAAGRIADVLETKVRMQDPENPEHPAEDVKGTVQFDHVTFAYPDAEEPVLKDIDFTAEKGQTVAFIGSTGSGKSTLVNLIPRFFDVTEGAVRVDGVDVRQMDRKDLRSRIGYVPQKSVLFSGTIGSNICYGVPDADKALMEEAARTAQAEEFISEREDGYRSMIAQGGSNVSGGQRQRLSIARAIAKKPEVLIFDDSFSALDFKTDAALRRALRETKAETTVLIVAQRISTIIHADQIIVLDDGKMAGKGTHAELMKTCEVYREIATSQLSEEELAG